MTNQPNEHSRPFISCRRTDGPVVGPADDVQTYLSALKLDYLMAVKNYTPMAGVARFRPERAVRRPRSVVMRPSRAANWIIAMRLCGWRISNTVSIHPLAQNRQGRGVGT